jgi:hypothetical protein
MAWTPIAPLGSGFEPVGEVEKLALVGRPALQAAGHGGESPLAGQASAGTLGVAHQQVGDRPRPVDDQQRGAEAERASSASML